MPLWHLLVVAIWCTAPVSDKAGIPEARYGTVIGRDFMVQRLLRKDPASVRLGLALAQPTRRVFVLDGDGSLLDSSLIYFGAGMSNGLLHDRHNVPAALIEKERSNPSSKVHVNLVVIGHVVYLSVFAPHLATKLLGLVTVGPTEQLFAGVPNQPL